MFRSAERQGRRMTGQLSDLNFSTSQGSQVLRCNLRKDGDYYMLWAFAEMWNSKIGSVIFKVYFLCHSWYKCTLFSVAQAMISRLIFHLLQAKCKYWDTKAGHFSKSHRSNSTLVWYTLEMAKTQQKVYKILQVGTSPWITSCNILC